MKTSSDKQIRQVVSELQVLIATIRALLNNAPAKATLLGNYDDISALLVGKFAECGLSEEELMELERTLAKLRITLDEVTS